MNIRLLDEDDAEPFAAFRRASLIDAPLALTASPDDDFILSADDARRMLRGRPDWVVAGAFEEGTLVAAAGLYRNRHIKVAHKTYLWGVYVAPPFRGQGLARAVVEAAIAHARAMPGVEWVQLSVSSGAPAAQKLYESLGFEHWGEEPDALRYQGVSVVERHMALRLE